jgi:hypothetical protein
MDPIEGGRDMRLKSVNTNRDVTKNAIGQKKPKRAISETNKLPVLNPPKPTPDTT